jgi:serine/threonine-protein kinase HipA
VRRCPITYDALSANESRYSRSGLRYLSTRLKGLSPLELSSEELVREAAVRATRMSVGGVQPKVSATLNVAAGQFDIVNTGGKYILKPQNPSYAHVPENEDVTMKLAALAGIDVPIHALVWTADNEFCYAIRRFDRIGRKAKLAVEDFGQLQERSRDTKYDSSIERVAETIEKYCTFPSVEKIKLFRRVLFSFLIGNEDMHLKNYSLISTAENLITLSPAYDLLNSALYVGEAEESALPINGKKSNLKRTDLIEYLARERLKLADAIIENVVGQLESALAKATALLERSFLPGAYKKQYVDLVARRLDRLRTA